ncbi:MAG: threonylcarbamoyl-AMP synthase [Oscillospiraceae bacterium]|nr:threonylcarbamoyl-AMP synthase [Oscillospiraceae bacterium]
MYDTKVLQCNSEGIEKAAELLKVGETVAIPTETVYGLAANALDEKAVKRIFEVKGRPQDNPLIVHISDISMWGKLVKEITPDALKLAESFWPGPLTMILPKSDLVPDTTTAGMDSVAVRMPSHEGARTIIAASGLPIAAPSANLSGLPSPTSAEHCVKDLSGKIPLIIDGGHCTVGIESTVVSLSGEPIVLRPGAITPEMLSAALGKEVGISHTAVEPMAAGEKPLSPGMKYRHYAPKAKLVLVESTAEAFAELLNNSPEGTYGLIFENDSKLMTRPCIAYGKEHDAESQAREVFAALRELDDSGAQLIYARCPDRDEASLGVFNRMLRAAAFEVIKL